MGDSESEQLLWGIKNGDMEQVKQMFEQSQKKVDVQLNGRSLLHHAADYGQDEIMELLIENGANVNQPDKHGITPLLAAIFEGHTKCIKLLLAKGAKKDGKAPDGSSYIDVAETDEIKALLK